MNKNKQVLNHCPNFYKIINFEFLENDKLSLKLVSTYKDYIFSVDCSNASLRKKIESLDLVLNKYIDDYTFRKEIRRSLLELTANPEDNFMEVIVDHLINGYDNYDAGYTRNFYFARWI